MNTSEKKSLDQVSEEKASRTENKAMNMCFLFYNSYDSNKLEQVRTIRSKLLSSCNLQNAAP